MKSKLKAYLYLCLAFSFALVCAAPLVKAMQLDGPVNAIGAIAVPGGVGAVDILWVDQARGRLLQPQMRCRREVSHKRGFGEFLSQGPVLAL